MTTRSAHHLTVRVYYEDTDFSGAVYHANYLRFFERGRTELLRSLGVSQSAAIEGSGEAFAFAVRRITVDFRRPAHMDDLLEVMTHVDKVAGASIDLDQAIWREGELLAEAKVLIACVAGGVPRPLPETLGAQLRMHID